MQLKRRDDGFTLIELLMSIAILGIIAFPLGNAVISYFHNTDATVARLGESHDAQIAAAYFAQDVESIGVRNWTSGSYDAATKTFLLQQSVEVPQGGVPVSYNSGLYPCGAAGTPDALLRIAWDDFSAGGATPTPPPQIRVAYVVELTATETQLHRITCTSSAPLTPTSDVVIVHHLDPAHLPVVTCLTSTGSTSCTGTGAAVPQYLSLPLTIKDSADTDPLYIVTLTGQRRQT